MKEDILQRLSVTINALNCIYVKGKANLANLSGSISMLEEVCEMLSSIEFKAEEGSDPAE